MYSDWNAALENEMTSSLVITFFQTRTFFSTGEVILVLMLTTNNKQRGPLPIRNLCLCVCVFVIPRTCLTGVVHQDDLFEQDGGRRVQDAVDCPQEGGPGLVVEDDDDAGGGQRGAAAKPPLNAPEPHKRVGAWEGGKGGWCV